MRRFILFLFVMLVVGRVSAQTTFYSQYASTPNVKVAYVSNFELDSGIFTDVTTIEAMNDEGWAWMCKEFSVAELSDEQRLALAQGEDVFMFTQRDKDNLRNAVMVKDELVDEANCCYVGVSYPSRRIFIFSFGSENEQNAIVAFMVEKVLRRQSEQ